MNINIIQEINTLLSRVFVKAVSNVSDTETDITVTHKNRICLVLAQSMKTN